MRVQRELDADEELAERTEMKTLYTDGGSNGAELDEALAEREQFQSGILGGKAEGVGREQFNWEVDEGQRSSQASIRLWEDDGVKPVSEELFTFRSDKRPRLGYERCSAKELGLDESWFRDATFENPELVLGACRAAGLTDDEWYPWQREFRVEVGQIDVLLLSSEGRVAVVETKLATNPENRRRVLAQALDYLVHLRERFEDGWPEIPLDEGGDAVAAQEDIMESVAQGDALVVIASDEIDSRVAKLSLSLFSDHLMNHWDLALVDLALYRPVDGSDSYIVVPHLRNLVRSEPRHVVRVVVEGETPSARIEVERIASPRGQPGRQKWDEIRFFRYLDEGTAPAAIRELALQLRDVAGRYPDSVTLAWGTGKHGSMMLKRRNGALIEIHGRGEIRFRPRKFTRALGETAAAEYLRALEQLLPEAMGTHYLLVPAAQAEEVAPALLDLIRRTLDGVEESDGQ
jgi:hypothetical protein